MNFSVEKYSKRIEEPNKEEDPEDEILRLTRKIEELEDEKKRIENEMNYAEDVEVLVSEKNNINSDIRSLNNRISQIRDSVEYKNKRQKRWEEALKKNTVDRPFQDIDLDKLPRNFKEKAVRYVDILKESQTPPWELINIQLSIKSDSGSISVYGYYSDSRTESMDRDSALKVRLSDHRQSTSNVQRDFNLIDPENADKIVNFLANMK